MKKTLNQIITLAQVLAQCKVAGITDTKEKFSLVRLLTTIQPHLEGFDKAREQSQKMFANDNQGANAFLREELDKTIDLPFDGISLTTYEQLCTTNDSLTIGQLSLLADLVNEELRIKN